MGFLIDGGTLVKSAGSGATVIAARVRDDSLIEVATGTLDLTRALGGAGTLKIDTGATLEVDGAAAKTLTATFWGADATLALREVARFATAIAAFATGDVIDLLNTAATGSTLQSGKLMITQRWASGGDAPSVGLGQARHFRRNLRRPRRLGRHHLGRRLARGRSPPSVPAVQRADVRDGRGRRLRRSRVSRSRDRAVDPFSHLALPSSARRGQGPSSERLGHRRINQGAQVAAQGEAGFGSDHLGHHEHHRQILHVGSIQKAVEAKLRPRKYSPSVPGRRVLATSVFTPQPSEKPIPE